MESYIEWFDGRRFFTETGTARCKRSVFDALEIVPDYAYAFRFFDKPETPDLGPNFVVSAKRQNESGLYYINASVWTQDDVATYLPDHDILLSNMRGNDWKYVVKTRTGSFQPFDPSKDMIVRCEK